MKMRSPVIIMTLACCAAGIACVTVPYQPVYTQPSVPAVARSGAENEPFYDDLTPYGDWVYVSGPGWAWVPYNPPAGWRPYQLGHWVFTDYGWTWASDESFGWAVYHYGRWYNDPESGWVWVPGTEWGPAWVAWHEGGGWVGWAPLPWQVRWQAGVGLDWGGVSLSVALGPSSWYFVQARDMIDPSIRFRVAPSSRNVTLIQITQNVTNYTYVDNRIVDQSVKVEQIGRAVGRTVPRYRIRSADSPEATRGGKVRGEEFVVFRPASVRRANPQGRLVPPGHDDKQPPGDQRPDAAQQKAAPQGPPSESTAPGRESEQRSGTNEQHRSRFFKVLEQQRKRDQAPQPPSEKVPPTRPARPEQGAAPTAPTTPATTRNDHPAPGNLRDGVAPPSGPGAVNPPPDRPGQAKAQPTNSKTKRPRGGPPKSGKPKPAASGSEGPASDKPKAEKPNSEDKD